MKLGRPFDALLLLLLAVMLSFGVQAARDFGGDRWAAFRNHLLDPRHRQTFGSSLEAVAASFVDRLGPAESMRLLVEHSRDVDGILSELQRHVEPVVSIGITAAAENSWPSGGSSSVEESRSEQRETSVSPIHSIPFQLLVDRVWARVGPKDQTSTLWIALLQAVRMGNSLMAEFLLERVHVPNVLAGPSSALAKMLHANVDRELLETLVLEYGVRDTQYHEAARTALLGKRMDALELLVSTQEYSVETLDSLAGLAVSLGLGEAVQSLVVALAQQNSDDPVRGAFLEAANRGNMTILAWLLHDYPVASRRCMPAAAMSACRHGQTEVLRYFTLLGDSPLALPFSMVDVFYESLRSKQLEMMEMMLEYGASVRANPRTIRELLYRIGHHGKREQFLQVLRKYGYPRGAY